MEGRTFIGTGPSAEEIGELTDRPSIEPIRVFAGLANAEDTEQQAALAVADLERAGGFERQHLAGGHHRPGRVGRAERGERLRVRHRWGLRDRRDAVLAPPLLAVLFVDSARARDAGRALFDAVDARWSSLPFDERPELLRLR